MSRGKGKKSTHEVKMDETNISEKSEKQKDIFMLTGEHGVFDGFFTGGYAAEGFPIEKKELPNQALREKLLKEGIVNGFRILTDPTENRIMECDPENNFVVADIFRAIVDYRRPEHCENPEFKDYEKYLEHYWDPVFEAMSKYPDTVWACSIGEVDSCHAWDCEKFFRSKKEAYEYWKKAFHTASYNKGNNVFGQLLDYLRKSGIKLNEANIMINCSMMFSIHYFYEWGHRMVWLEGAGVSEYQVGIAFVRGASKQFNGLWGIDSAQYHPNGDSPTYYDAEGRQRNGFTPSLMLRNWMTTFLSGGNFLHEQTSGLTHWIYNEKSDFRLSPCGDCAAKFADFALRRHSNRGQPYVPCALMLNYYHGYDHARGIYGDSPFVWNGKIPFTNEDANIDNFLDMFFPNHNAGAGWCDKVFNLEVPWKSMQEQLEMLKNGVDMRPYEEHRLVNSPFGDSLDVILDNADSETLDRYKIIFLGGEQELSEEQGNRLLSYVDRGGTLVTSIKQIPGTVISALGINVNESKWDYDITRCLADNEEFGDMRYAYSIAEIQNARILGVNHLDVPLIWEVSRGKGKIVLTAIPYSQDFSGTELMPLYKHIFSKYIDDVIIVKTNPASLQTIMTKGEDFYIIAAINNYRTPWQGSLTIKKPVNFNGKVKAEDIWNEEGVSVNEDNGQFVINTSIDPFEFKVIKIFFDL